MIQIKHQEDCCGCEACVQICPANCISFTADKEGFYYPSADNKLCIHCNLCEKVCPVLNQAANSLPKTVYATQHPNKEVRKVSSSGGIFTLIASIIIKEGGVVFGARFDKNWNVIHDFTETIEGLQAFQGSKYVQSRIGNSYQLAEQYLKKGRKVMFTGTSCQIAGLKKFLRKEYNNLLAVDIICHGVPSPLVWQKFLTDCLNHHKTTRKSLMTFTFRDKQSGWKKYQSTYTIQKKVGLDNHVTSHSLKYEENSYMQAFLNNYTLRPSCYQCPAKNGKSCSDITLDWLDANLDIRGMMTGEGFDGAWGSAEHDGVLSATVGLTYKFKRRGWDRSKTVYRYDYGDLESMRNKLNEMNAENERLKKELAQGKMAAARETVKRIASANLETFPIGKSKLSNEARANLGMLAEVIKADDKNAVYTITGYADAGTGSKRINEKLSKARAEAVYECLVEEFGIDKAQLKIDYKGGVENMFYDDPRLSRAVITRAE